MFGENNGFINIFKSRILNYILKVDVCLLYELVFYVILFKVILLFYDFFVMVLKDSCNDIN